MNAADIDHLRMAVAWGASDEHIAATFGLSASTIRRHRLAHQVRRAHVVPVCTPRPLGPGVRSIIIRLHNAGRSVRWIAGKLRMGSQRVRRVVEVR